MKKTTRPSSKKSSNSLSRNLRTHVTQRSQAGGNGVALKNASSHSRNSNAKGRKISRNGAFGIGLNPHGIPDWRLEKPDFTTVEVSKNGAVHYEVRGNLRAAVPPLRDS